MELAEKETIIVFNAADMTEGFFRFGTSDQNAFKRLRRILGKDYDASFTRESHARRSATYWDVRVPIAYHRPTFFGISRKPRFKPPTPGQKGIIPKGFTKKENI